MGGVEYTGTVPPCREWADFYTKLMVGEDVGPSWALRTSFNAGATHVALEAYFVLRERPELFSPELRELFLEQIADWLPDDVLPADAE